VLKEGIGKTKSKWEISYMTVMSGINLKIVLTIFSKAILSCFSQLSAHSNLSCPIIFFQIAISFMLDAIR
jgi:hypothetical protein